MPLEEFSHLRKQFWGRHLRARGYFAVTSGTITDKMVRDTSPSKKGNRFTTTVDFESTIVRTYRLPGGSCSLPVACQSNVDISGGLTRERHDHALGAGRYGTRCSPKVSICPPHLKLPLAVFHAATHFSARLFLRGIYVNWNFSVVCTTYRRSFMMCLTQQASRKMLCVHACR